MFSKLVFHGVDEDLLEREILSYLTNFIKQLDVDWQETREADPTSTPFLTPDNRRRR
jgi:hypothetical protein